MTVRVEQAEGSDEQIVQEVLNGKRERFAVLMRRYNQRLFRVCRSVVANDAEAEEAMQEAYLRAYRHLEQFENRAKFSTWLTKIAFHEALARKRRSWRFVPLDLDVVEAQRSPARGAQRDTPEDEAARDELRAALEAAIGRLPESYRTAFVLRYIEGMSTTETAACLDISTEAVKSRLFRSRKLLRPSLELFRREGRLHEFLGARCDRFVLKVMKRL